MSDKTDNTTVRAVPRRRMRIVPRRADGQAASGGPASNDSTATQAPQRVRLSQVAGPVEAETPEQRTPVNDARTGVSHAPAPPKTRPDKPASRDSEAPAANSPEPLDDDLWSDVAMNVMPAANNLFGLEDAADEVPTVFPAENSKMSPAAVRAIVKRTTTQWRDATNSASTRVPEQNKVHRIAQRTHRFAKKIISNKRAWDWAWRISLIAALIAFVLLMQAILTGRLSTPRGDDKSAPSTHSADPHDFDSWHQQSPDEPVVNLSDEVPRGRVTGVEFEDQPGALRRASFDTDQASLPQLQSTDRTPAEPVPPALHSTMEFQSDEIEQR